ncbi:MAG: hypothetical protein ABIZ04_07450 [Opitutus sp.]
MKPFRYAVDPICVVACGLYALNRWYLAPHFGGAFLHGYFNDVLLIPAALPFVLWLQRRLGCRTTDQRPNWGEIALHLAVWSFTAEVLVPKMSSHAISDWKDVVAYSAGAVLAGCGWQEWALS